MSEAHDRGERSDKAEKAVSDFVNALNTLKELDYDVDKADHGRIFNGLRFVLQDEPDDDNTIKDVALVIRVRQGDGSTRWDYV